MIYISSGCSQFRDIYKSIEEINSWGYYNIELTGNIDHFNHDSFKEFALENEKSLNLRTHNYFPAPNIPFVMNLSGQDEVQKKTIKIMKEAFEFSKIFKNKKLGFHAGFRLDPNASELGKRFMIKDMISIEEAIDRMKQNIEGLPFSSELYLENNVYSDSNKKVYGDDNPFLLCSFDDYLDLKSKFNFKMLLDVGHLKVSCQSLGYDFEDQLSNFLDVSDYIHVSDNNGIADQNMSLLRNSLTYEVLERNKSKLKDIDFTVEVYSGEKDVKETVRNLESLCE